MVGGIFSTVGGAVPGGEHVARAISGGSQGLARIMVATGAIMGQTAHRVATGQSESVGQAFRDVTGIKEGGLQGTFRAVQRAGIASIAAVKHGNLNQLQQFQLQVQNQESLRPKRTIGFQLPTRRLE